MIEIGEKIRANDIKGRNVQLLDSPDDVQWALEVHAPEHLGKFNAVVLTGNEDAPDAVYGAEVRKLPVLISTIFTRLA